MWLDYWGMGGGTKDVLASPAKIIGGRGGRGASPSCSYAYVLLYTYRYMSKVRNAAGKSHGSQKMFLTSVMRGENTGKQTGGFRRQ